MPVSTRLFDRFRGHCVHLGGENFPNSQQSGKNSRVPCPNSFQSRFPGCSQFPNPVKTFCVFPNPALYFGQIPSFRWFNPYEHGKCLVIRNKVEIFMTACTSTFKISLDNFSVDEAEFKQVKPKLLLQRCQFSCTVFLQL